jgi:cytosine/adenosine deaminase-related metal-dependent hydrolase
MADETTFTARYVFPVAGPPLERGTFTFREGHIVAVSPHGQRTPDHDLDDAAIVPGFVNAHTHLDLTGAKGRTPPTPDFVGWLRQVIAYRRERTPEQVADDVRAGIAESLRGGTTLIGDIAAEGSSWGAVSAAPMRAIVFREMLGLSPERAKKAWWDMLLWSRHVANTPTCRYGLSPHAPYSVNMSVIRSAAWNGHNVAIHIAESRDELELLDHRRGSFVAFLNDLGVWHPEGLATGIGEVIRRTRRAPSALYVHCNYLAADTTFGRNATVVYCPRTHAAFGHPPHPFRDFLARGVRVALGTDSLGSNPDLSVLAEARFVRERYPDFDGATLLNMATLAGAEALGWAEQCGSLEPGKSADFAVVELPPQDARDPHDLLFASDRPVRATVFRGQLVAGNW